MELGPYADTTSRRSSFFLCVDLFSFWFGLFSPPFPPVISLCRKKKIEKHTQKSSDRVAPIVSYLLCCCNSCANTLSNDLNFSRCHHAGRLLPERQPHSVSLPLGQTLPCRTSLGSEKQTCHQNKYFISLVPTLNVCNAIGFYSGGGTVTRQQHANSSPVAPPNVVFFLCHGIQQ